MFGLRELYSICFVYILRAIFSLKITPFFLFFFHIYIFCFLISKDNNINMNGRRRWRWWWRGHYLKCCWRVVCQRLASIALLIPCTVFTLLVRYVGLSRRQWPVKNVLYFFLTPIQSLCALLSISSFEGKKESLSDFFFSFFTPSYTIELHLVYWVVVVLLRPCPVLIALHDTSLRWLYASI